MEGTGFLLYGANGYTGELIARHAIEYGLRPILAGRSHAATSALAKRLDMDFQVFDVNDKTSLLSALRNVRVVVNAAGPFQFTARQIIEACLETGTHYIDINGDLAVFEMIRNYDAAAKQSRIMLLPGAGFDVVPTDCLALFLKKNLPSATHLKLAFATIGGGLSHGTATTMIAKLGEGGAVRKNGQIIRSRLGEKGMWVDFGEKKLFTITIPWGDIATAYYTTGIPDIESYTGMPRKIFFLLKLQGAFNWLLRKKFIRAYLRKKINKRPAGPSDAQRTRAISLVFGAATDDTGNIATATMKGPEGYTLTTYSCLLIVKKILSGNYVTGYQTPALAYGEDLVLEVPGVTRSKIHIGKFEV
jgi:short subunit dehydrogenase-like uncharacterized protein